MSTQAIVFTRSCVKTMSAVEALPSRSHQHEFNGVTPLKALFGTDKKEFTASFSIRGTDAASTAKLTWYDARKANPTRSEYRLYFQSNPVMAQASEGDNIVIGFNKKGGVHCELIPVTRADHRGQINQWTML